ALETASSTVKIRLSRVDALHGDLELEQGIEKFSNRPEPCGLVVLPGPFAMAHDVAIITLAERLRLPAVYPFSFFLTKGGLVSYGPDLFEGHRIAANYADRILRGESPSGLPVQATTKYQLAVNLKTAKALGLSIPSTVLATADEVLE